MSELYLHLSGWTVLWVRWCKISITIAPVKRIRTTCMLKPKTHPHLCDNSEQHESKGGNAYVFLFVFSACAFWWDLSVSHATRNTPISMFLVVLWRREGAQKYTLSCKLIGRFPRQRVEHTLPCTESTVPWKMLFLWFLWQGTLANFQKKTIVFAF